MKAAVMHQLRDIRIEELPVPAIGPNEVLIKVRAVGICGSDLHYYTHGRIGMYVVEKPIILGHECSGDIAALGSLRRGGKLAVVGLPPQDEIPLNVPLIADNEIDIYGVFRYANTYPKGIRFLASGVVDAGKLVTDKYSLDQTQEAMERALNHKSECLKVVVYPNGR
jgi:threonine dehydrogenase-like Zn-dependent dehydrogenase